jgi:ligand-binding sensor domain-containing protein/serine phosphatase RsbU (regulator of sigma subunit)
VKVEFNPGDKYIVNAFTGDTILPVINSRGDTVMTGIPIRAEARRMDPARLSPPRTMRETELSVVSGARDVFQVPDNLDTHAVSFSVPENGFNPVPDSASLSRRNLFEDTIPTGVPIPISGTERMLSPSQPVRVFPPAMKERATRDIKFLDVYHGLISSQIVSMLEDRYGRIWLGSSGGGASIYDGTTVSNLTEREGLCNSAIIAMLEDSRGNLWFGSNGEGLIRFDGYTFTRFTEKDGLLSNVVESIVEDARGNIWFTQGRGISVFQQGMVIHYTGREGFPRTIVQALYEDSKGILWLGTRHGILQFDGTSFLSMDGLPRVSVGSILEDSQGILWFGTVGAGLYRYDGGYITFFSDAEGLSSNNVEALMEDHKGNIWVSTAGGGVNRFDGESFTHFTESGGLASDWIIPMLEDSYGNLWFGSLGGGVSIYYEASFRHFTENEGLSSPAVYAILEDRSGDIWFGTLFGGVTRYDGENLTHFTTSSGMGAPTVESLLEDRNGNLWFGTGGRGAVRYDGNSFTSYGRRQGLTNFPIGAMVEDRQGMLWFGTMGGGAVRYDGVSFEHFTDSEALVNNYVESMMEDSRGNIWIGHLGGGVTKYDGETFTHYTESEGLSSNHVGSMFEDSRGNIWFGTMTGGVNKFDGELITWYTTAQGLRDNYVQSVTEDRDGNIWISTDQGLNVIRKDPSGDSIQIFSFGLQEGLKGINFFQNSVLLDSKNRIWWGNTKSLTVLDLNNFEFESQPPATHLDRIAVNGRFTNFQRKEALENQGISFDSLTPYFNIPLHLELPSGSNHLTFFFSGIDWSAPQEVRFSYKVHGVDEEWSSPRREPFADYRNLPYGTHSFEFRAMGRSRQWSEPVAYTFTIHPPWWQQWWAIGLYALILSALLYTIVRLRTGRLKKRQRELEELIRDRTVEISEMNDELRQQNVNLASQRDEIQDQKDQIQQQKQAMTDSITYARRIQAATLPPDEVVKYLFPKHFILFRPLNIVSGDFYWVAQKKGKVIIAVADCTGHGVPGAFMGMLGSALINEIVNSVSTLEPHLILNELRDQVITSLRQTGETDEARDGMDITLCVLDPEKLLLQYSGANHTLYVVKEGNLTEIEGDHMPIGISSEAGKSFTRHEVQLHKGDTLYLFSDGYVDQMGGERRKRFTTSRFKKLLLEIQDQIMFEQKRILERTLDEWMVDDGSSGHQTEQIDDVTILGIKI